MKFLENNSPLKDDEVLSRFPSVSEIYLAHKDLDINFEIDKNRIKLISPYSNPVTTNIEGELDYHKKFFFKNSLHKEPLAKALGIKKGVEKPIVLDATAGMLGDTLLIYAFGCKVFACERNPIASILAINALSLTETSIDFTYGEASQFDWKVDVVYFDPMYEEKNEKALPKKEMRIFREVVGIDKDANTVASLLRAKAKRLVIKRSVKASPILENPHMQITGKSTRYDVYLQNH